ncbi:MAG: hypothetical protein IAC23_06295 [Bacteroidetes bacterium]|uniref:DUF3575 domain-containing protein n=1 Tax=Candidatus Cryptobacteroides merdavium TaxID=2840769 RepID=A0A9D9EEY8_9BACT|nr:hypothetical protein [Candidatus Cryptobacteroides merdavium]
MGRRFLHILLLITLLLDPDAACGAGPGPKAAGAEFAFSGIGLNWQKHASGNTFHDMTLEADLYNVLSGKSRCPGIRFSYIKDFIFASSEHEDFVLNWYAGPGFTAGYVMDHACEEYGLMTGLCANVGVEFNFEVPVCISIGLMPSLAAHFVKEEGNLTLNIYTNGLMHILSPKLGIKYRF